MIRRGWFVLSLHGLLAAMVVAAPSLDVAELSPVSVTNLQRSGDRTILTLTFDAPTWESLAVGGEELFLPRYKNQGELRQAGLPALPVIGRFVQLPASGAMRVEVRQVEYDLIEDVDVARFAGTLDDPAFSKTGDVVQGWYPAQPVTLGEPALMRDLRVASLTTHPVQVNPARREARVCRSMELELIPVDQASVNELPAEPTRLSKTFLPQYRRLLNWDESALDQFTLYQGGMVVVTQSAALGGLSGWLEWKRQMGWTVDLFTEEDADLSNSSSIMAGLQTAYEAMETPFEFIVIVGDGNGSFAIPPASGSLGGYGDHRYSCVHGMDNLADAAIGRISVETEAQLVGYANKVLFYEKSPYMGETGWFKRGMVAAGAVESGPTTILIGRYARHRMLDIGFTQVDTAWYNDGLGDVNERITDAFENGLSFFLYRGLIGSGLDISGIFASPNPFRLPFILDITCSTGNWFGETGLNEAWMRAGTPTSPRGGIGAIGTATAHTHTAPNNALTAGAVEALFVDQIPEIGMAWYGAMMNLYQNFVGNQDEYVNDFSVWANLMGDPTVRLWTDTPHELTVETVGTIPLQQRSLEVAVSDDGVPVKDAWVTYYRTDQPEVLVAHGTTDATGHVFLATPNESTGEAMLTVTAQNGHPVQRAINVVDGIGPVIRAVTFVDDGTGDSEGNGNGMVEAGEMVGLRFTLRNEGNSVSAPLSISGETSDPMLGTVWGTAEVGALDPGEEAESSSMIYIVPLSDAREEWVSRVDLTLTSGDLVTEDHLLITLHAPRFSVLELRPESPIGPGEEGLVTFRLGHTGSSLAGGGTVYLRSLESYLTAWQEGVTLPPMAPGEEVVGQFRVMLDDDAYYGYEPQVRLVIDLNGGWADTLYSTITMSDREATDPLGQDNYGYFAFDDTDVGFDKAPVYDWFEICPDAEGADFEGALLEQIVDRNYWLDEEIIDFAQIVELPFPVQYYGEVFDSLTISANGFVAMGTQRDMPLGRNWHIPSPGGPNYMIAPYWDDRVVDVDVDTPDEIRGVYHHYDAAGGRYIIEWYNVADWVDTSLPTHGPISSCTFQLVFFDQSGGHVTESGDTEFLFQYGELNHTLGYVENDNPFFTTGIENGDQSDGLMASYWNVLEPGMADIAAGRAILFTTGYGPTVDVADLRSSQPLTWSLEEVYPNPFNPTTTIRFQLKESADVSILLYDLLGREVATVVRSRMGAGRHQVTLDGSNLATGIYFLQMQAGPLKATRKVMLLK